MEEVNLEQIHKGGVYRYEETFCKKISKAIVKVRRVESDEYEYKISVRVLEVQQGRFPKFNFRIVINRKNNYMQQRFYKVGL